MSSSRLLIRRPPTLARITPIYTGHPRRNLSSTMSAAGGKYIVVFKEHVTKEEVDRCAHDINQNGGQVGNDFGSLLKGFSATIPDSYMNQLQSLQAGAIDYIEPDQVVTTQ